MGCQRETDVGTKEGDRGEGGIAAVASLLSHRRCMAVKSKSGSVCKSSDDARTRKDSEVKEEAGKPESADKRQAESPPISFTSLWVIQAAILNSWLRCQQKPQCGQGQRRGWCHLEVRRLNRASHTTAKGGTS